MIAFRLDANESVASGHLFRCMSVARQCRELGQECVFIMSDNSMADVVKKENFKCCVLDLRWDDYTYNIEELIYYIKEENVSCLVVDSYHVSTEFFELIKNCVPVFYLDDICERAYPIDAVVHYSEWEGDNIISDLYNDCNTQVYYGMKYMPLREGFFFKPNAVKEYDILITTGGSDTYHVTRDLVKSIQDDIILKNLQICVVLGKMNQDEEEIRLLVKNSGNYTILKNITNMNEVMQKSRIAVTAGGTTVYELMASGVMFSVFAFSDDQVIFGKRLEAHNNAIYAGDSRENAPNVILNLKEAIHNMLSLGVKEREMKIVNNLKLVDGKGALRLAEIITMIASKNR